LRANIFDGHGFIPNAANGRISVHESDDPRETDRWWVEICTQIRHGQSEFWRFEAAAAYRLRPTDLRLRCPFYPYPTGSYATPTTLPKTKINLLFQWLENQFRKRKKTSWLSRQDDCIHSTAKAWFSIKTNHGNPTTQNPRDHAQRWPGRRRHDTSSLRLSSARGQLLCPRREPCRNAETSLPTEAPCPEDGSYLPWI